MIITGERYSAVLVVVRPIPTISGIGHRIAADEGIKGIGHLKTVIFESLVLNKHVVLHDIVGVKCCDFGRVFGARLDEPSQAEMKITHLSRCASARVDDQVVADGDV